MGAIKGRSNLEHQVWKFLKKNGLTQKKILISLSGGVDSLALLRVLSRVHGLSNLAACYFHHGPSQNKIYRDKCGVFCEKVCQQFGVEFFFLESQKKSISEAELREQRYSALQELMDTHKFDLLATGHHADDLLETRLIRLIRGTGSQGLVAISTFKGNIIRPFLGVSKLELARYLKSEKLRPLNDPSNRSLDPLRNWIRRYWLKVLEKNWPGSASALARSLELLASEVEEKGWGELLNQNDNYREKGLSRAFFVTLSESEQRRLLAQYLFVLGVKNFTHSQINEIQKRLDNPQKVITFRVGGCLWQINAEQIKVQS